MNILHSIESEMFALIGDFTFLHSEVFLIVPRARDLFQVLNLALALLRTFHTESHRMTRHPMKMNISVVPAPQAHTLIGMINETFSKGIGLRFSPHIFCF